MDEIIIDAAPDLELWSQEDRALLFHIGKNILSRLPYYEEAQGQRFSHLPKFKKVKVVIKLILYGPCGLGPFIPLTLLLLLGKGRVRHWSPSSRELRANRRKQTTNKQVISILKENEAVKRIGRQEITFLDKLIRGLLSKEVVFEQRSKRSEGASCFLNIFGRRAW